MPYVQANNPTQRPGHVVFRGMNLAFQMRRRAEGRPHQVGSPKQLILRDVGEWHLDFLWHVKVLLLDLIPVPRGYRAIRNPSLGFRV